MVNLLPRALARYVKESTKPGQFQYPMQGPLKEAVTFQRFFAPSGVMVPGGP